MECAKGEEMKLEVGDKVRRRPGYLNRPELIGKTGTVVWVEGRANSTSSSYRISVEFAACVRLSGVFAAQFDLVTRSKA